MIKRNTLAVSFVLSTLLSSCGGDNEVGQPTVPIQGIGLQKGNLLQDFDPSFENSQIRSTRRGLKIYPYFRVGGTSRRGDLYDVTGILSHSGSKSLRLQDGENQKLLYPTDTRVKGSPLKLSGLARYRLTYFIALPESRRRSQRSFGSEVRIEFERNFQAIGHYTGVLRKTPNRENKWMSFQFEFETPSQVDSARMNFEFFGGNDFLIDSFSLQRIR